MLIEMIIPDTIIS